jgi:chromosome segregation ATPase
MSLSKIESSENEKKILIQMNSKVHIGTLLEIYNEDENRKILDSKKPIRSYFQNCYNDQSAIAISRFAFLERYFKKIEEKNPEIARSVTELFKDADNFPRKILFLKKKHNEIIGMLGQIKLKIASNFEDFERALVNDNQRALHAALQLINAKEEIDECNGLLKQLKENFEDFEPKIIDSKVFGAGAEVQKNYTTNSKLKRELKDGLKDELNSIVASKYAADVNCEILIEKIEKTDLTVSTLNKLKEKLEKDKLDLENSIDGNDAAREKLFKEINDPNRHIEFLKNCDERRKQLDSNFLSNMNKVRNKQVDILQDVEETKVLNKLYHLIFFLDESGSMEDSFDVVRDSVYQIIKNRNLKTKSDERISIIKFDTETDIVVLDESIRDKIKISDLKGGGTSFIKPLEKFEEILQGINSDIYVPIVFFLSDGYAESISAVSTKCQDIFKKYSKFSLIFLSVGFGDDPDGDTLKEMSKIFNNGSEVLKIGNEMIKLYHRAGNQEQLLKVFSLFEKLFDYQKNFIQQKTDFLNNLMDETENNRKKDSEILENMFQINEKSTNNRLEESKKHAQDIENNLKNLNEIFKQKKNEISERINKIEDSIKELEENKTEYKQELAKIKPKCVEYDTDYDEFRERFDKTNLEYKEALKQENESLNELLKNSENYRKENISEQMKFLKELGITFRDEEEENNFTKNYSDLQAYYYEFIKSKHDVNEAANNLETEFKNVVYYMGIINKKIGLCESLFSPESIKGIVWDLVKFFLSSKFDVAYKNDDMNFLYKIVLKEINFKSKSSDDDTDDEDSTQNRFKKAFDLVFKDLSPSSTLTKLESDPSYESSFLDFCSTKIDEIRDFIKEEKKSIKKIEKEKDVNNEKQQIRIQKGENEIEKLEEQIDEYKEYKREIKKITNVINDFRLQTKERYLKEVMAKKITSIFANVKNQLIPQIDVIKDSRTVRAIRN